MASLACGEGDSTARDANRSVRPASLTRVHPHRDVSGSSAWMLQPAQKEEPVAEVRASDFVGPGAQSALGERIAGRVRQGKNVSVLGRADRPHTWSFTDDVARMLVVAGTDPRAWGGGWQVLSNEPLSQRQVIGDLAR